MPFFFVSVVTLVTSGRALAQSAAPGASPVAPAAPAGALPPLPAAPETAPPATTPDSTSAAPPAPREPPPPVEEAPTAPGGGYAPGGPGGPDRPPPGYAFFPRHYRHQGFYLAADTGIGVLSTWGSGPWNSASLTGVANTTAIAAGGTIAPGLVLGGVARQWSTMGTFNGGPPITATATYSVNGVHSTSTFPLSGNAKASTAEVGAFLDWYPNPEDGWHAGASLSLGSITITDDAGSKSNSAGVAGSLFGGYQWWLGPAWSLGLSAVISSGTMSTLDDGGMNQTGYRLMPLAAGLQTELLFY